MFEKVFHPWEKLRDLKHIEVIWKPLNGRLGQTNGTNLIYLHPHQTQTQRRSTLAHELAHIQLGHTTGCSPVEEALACSLAATWLIPLPRLIDAMRWSEDLEEIADELWVDLSTLKTRLERLTRAEARALREALEDK